MSAAGAIGCQTRAESRAPVRALYAGSLTAVMERGLGPAFAHVSRRAYRGEPAGSLAGARLVSGGVRRPDVYVTADSSTLSLLEPYWGGWAVAFARGELTVAWGPSSRFGNALDSVAEGTLQWVEVVLRPGFRLGRTDPDLDPKGYRTLWLFELAGRYEADASLAERLRAASSDRKLVFPEAHLAARVESGQLDAGAFYLAEARAHGLRTLRLPPALHQGSPEHEDLYASLRYRMRDGKLVHGTPILYWVTIPMNAEAPEAGAEFVRFLVSGTGREVLAAAGLPPAREVIGEPEGAPRSLQELWEPGPFPAAGNRNPGDGHGPRPPPGNGP